MYSRRAPAYINSYGGLSRLIVRESHIHALEIGQLTVGRLRKAFS
jgi:hypothetical protein